MADRYAPDPLLVMAVRTDAHWNRDAEPVLVDLDGTDLVLRLDDGNTLTFDVAELRTAIEALLQRERQTDARAA
jgi:hypothetical protein